MPLATAMEASLGVVNPNLSSQISAWQAARRANGEDPNDWGAFRRHMIAIQSPDPGETPAPQFGEAQPGAGTYGGTAGGSATYPTPNGPRSIAQMTTELKAAGYPGPWDDTSVIAAYNRTAGGGVTPGEGTTPTPTPTPGVDDWVNYGGDTLYPSLPGGTPGTEQFKPEEYWWSQPGQWAQAGLEKSGLMAGPFGQFMQRQQQRPLGQWDLLTELAKAQQQPLPSLDILNQMLAGGQKQGTSTFQQLWDILKGGLPGGTGVGAAELGGQLAELGNRPEDVLKWYEATRPYLSQGLSSTARSTIWNRYLQEVMSKPNMPFMQWLLGGGQ